jgi:murein DD-endopeptidase MepM/ murein hydrolase activator NlpD
MRFLRSIVVLTVVMQAACYRSVADPLDRPPTRAALTTEEVVYFDKHRLMVPVDGVHPRELRDSFNAPRGAGRTHGAIDILAPHGTPVVAAIGGQVFRLRQNVSGGITAYLSDSSRRYVYYYAHLNSYSAGLTEGQQVKQGSVIGYVGTTGNAPPDTPHLHFQVMRIAPEQRDWWNGTAIDVRAFMTLTGKAHR